jgi:hypothetical protein
MANAGPSTAWFARCANDFAQDDNFEEVAGMLGTREVRTTTRASATGGFLVM